MDKFRRVLKLIIGICSVGLGGISIIWFVSYGGGEWWHYLLAIGLICWGAWDIYRYLHYKDSIGQSEKAN
jgi:hypothetical protein